MKPAVKVWRSRFAAGWMLSAVCAFSLNAAEPLMVNGVVVEASAATAAAARDMAIPALLQRTWGRNDFGVYARMTEPGDLGVGDAVSIAT